MNANVRSIDFHVVFLRILKVSLALNSPDISLRTLLVILLDKMVEVTPKNSVL